MRPSATVHHLSLRIAVSLALGAAASVHASQPTQTDWSPPLRDALTAYRSGDFEETVRACRRIAADYPGGALEREAELLSTLTFLWSADRNERLDARARLAAITADRPDLGGRAECLLALGVACDAQNETGQAILALDAAAGRFEAIGPADRCATALVRLARVWTRHNEWNIAVPGVDVAPATPADARALRKARLAAIRDRAAACAGGSDATAQVELVLAEYLASSPDDQAEAIELLSRLAAADPFDATAAHACLRLGQMYEESGATAEALRLYRKVRGAALGDWSAQAQAALAALERPGLEIDAPPRVSADHTLLVRLRARNVRALRVEVRRVDVATWIAARSGRFSESSLPEEGAVVAVERFESTARQPHEWWDAQLRCHPPRGAFVVIGRNEDDGGSTAWKRLVLVSDLTATLFTGARQAIACVNRSAARLRFWMESSLAPLERELADGVVTFPLPPEAQLPGSRRWICLIDSDGEQALCGGRLDETAAMIDRPDGMLLSVAPGASRIAETVAFVGLVPALGSAAPADRRARLELRLVDSLDNVLAAVPAALDPAGVFTARATISAAMAGKHLRPLVRVGEKAIEAAYRQASLTIAPRDPCALSATVLLPSRLDPSTPLLNGFVEARLPWQTPLGRLKITNRIDLVALPLNEPPRDLLTALPQRRRGMLDERGRGALVVPLATFGLPDGPKAALVGLNALGPDGRACDARHEVILSDEPAHVWIRLHPPDPRVGQPVEFRVGWFDPQFRAAGRTPELSIQRDGVTVARLPLWRDAEMRSAPWFPPQPGRYEAVATLPESGATVARRSIDIHPPDREAGWSAHVASAERIDRNGAPRVRVRLTGHRPEPTLLLARDAEPRAATWVPAGDADETIELALPALTGDDLRVAWLRPTGHSLEAIDDRTASPPDPATPILELVADDPAAVRPGVQRFELRIPDGDSLRGATLIARLARVRDSGAVAWRGQPARTLASRSLGVRYASALDAPAAADSGSAVLPPTELYAPEIVDALTAGETLWTEVSAVVSDAMRFDVPEPDDGIGPCRVWFVLRTADGRSAAVSRRLDGRSPVRLRVAAPDALTLGDRTSFSILVRNESDAPQSGRVAFDAGRAATLADVQVIAPRRAAPLERENDGYRLTVPARATVVLAARLEASRVGRSAAEASFVSTGGRVRETAPYRVFPAEDDARDPTNPTSLPNHAATIEITRSVFWLQPLHHDEPETLAIEGAIASTTPPPLSDAARVVLRPGQSLSGGTLVLIQDTFTLPSAATAVTWTQRAPANCVTLGGDLSEWRTIGPMTDRGLADVTFAASHLPAGRWQHECVVVTVRGGACELPPPRIRIDGRPAPVRVVQDINRLIVAD